MLGEPPLGSGRRTPRCPRRGARGGAGRGGAGRAFASRRSSVGCLLLGCLLGAGLLLGTGPGQAFAEEPAAPPRLLDVAKDIADLTARIEALAKRLADVLLEANRDPDERKVDEYLNYSAAEMQKTKKNVDAEQLVGWMTDPKRDFNFRVRCKDALLQGMRRGDVDLTIKTKVRKQTMRGYFFRRNIVPMLTDADDQNNRAWGDSLLKEVFPSERSTPEVAAYDIKEKGTWSKAAAAWRKALEKQ